VAHALSKQLQEPVNHKRIASIMREYLVGARIRLRRHPAYWYRQRHTERLSDRQCAPNILNRDFLASYPRKNRGRLPIVRKHIKHCYETMASSRAIREQAIAGTMRSWSVSLGI